MVTACSAVAMRWLPAGMGRKKRDGLGLALDCCLVLPAHGYALLAPMQPSLIINNLQLATNISGFIYAPRDAHFHPTFMHPSNLQPCTQGRPPLVPCPSS